MDISVMFVDCPEYMDSGGSARCGLPAAVEYRHTVSSTDGPLESGKIRCPRGHSFNGPLDSLTWEKGQTEAALSEQSTRSGVRSCAAPAITLSFARGGQRHFCNLFEPRLQAMRPAD